jgi:hypothetical protein
MDALLLEVFVVVSGKCRIINDVFFVVDVSDHRSVMLRRVLRPLNDPSSIEFQG